MVEAVDKRRLPAQTFIERNRALVVVLLHALLFTLALLSAFALAYNFRRFDLWCLDFFLPLLALSLPIKLLVFWWKGQYRGSWRYVGLRDLFGVIQASLIGTFIFLGAYFILLTFWSNVFEKVLIEHPEELRQAVFWLDWAATVGLVCAARVLVRFYREEMRPTESTDLTRVLIAGAGDTGEALLREILRMPKEQYHCVGFLDDDVPHLHGRIHGVEIVGRTEAIHDLCMDLGVQEVLIALPHATPKVIRSLIERCEGLNVLFRTVPPMTDVIAGRVQVSQIREVDITDILGREPVKLDVDKIAEQLRGRRVLVTGAGGSIGSEMCRQVANFAPERLVLVEQAENALFEIDRELRQSYPTVDVMPYIADIVDRTRLRQIFDAEKPSVVFHAAAHKHVPMMEINPGEALKNNIGGTMAVVDVAAELQVPKVVMISTDKAVNPTSVMGCSKRVAEMYVQGLSGRSGTQFATVRFGNVLGSSGSVVPIFKQQIAAGGPVTVTHPEMTRYFMTIPEAAQLVLQAGTMGRGGEIYVLHMGEPVKIVDLAKDMITLSGLRPGVDIEITFCGTRPGEKLYEELSHEGEHVGDTAHPKIGIWKHRVQDWETVRRSIGELLTVADEGVPAEIRGKLHEVVPEYTQGDSPANPPPLPPPGSSQVAPAGLLSPPSAALCTRAGAALS